MTSPATDAATRRAFAAADHFGLPAADVIFVTQQQLPCLDLEGNLMIGADRRLAFSPDGHGGVFEALASSGALRQLREDGVDTLSYFQVDNALLPAVDPVAIGAHLARRSDWTVKVLEKRSWDEKLGTLVRAEDGLRVIEYTELGERLGAARDEDGTLRARWGAIGAHLLALALVEEVSHGPALPLHASPKRIPTLSADGSREMPATENGVKLERFVFDALACARRPLALGVARAREYAPLKNAEGVHSPGAVRAALFDDAGARLADAGLTLPPGAGAEIDPARFFDRHDFEAAGIRDPRAAGPAILIEKGGQP